MSKLTQIEFAFDEHATDKTNAPKITRNIQCFECKERAELNGYRFRLVPLCRPCRTIRELEITGNRFERRNTR